MPDKWSRSMLSFPIEREFSLTMPAGAKLLGIQGNAICALVDPDAELEERRFRLTGAAWHFPRCRYVGTYRLGCGAFVGHILEV